MNSKTQSLLYELLTSIFPRIDALEEKMLRNLNVSLTIGEVRILATIDKSKSTYTGEIAKALLITPGTLSIAVNRLENQGYVQRNQGEKDKRFVALSLTPKGKKIVSLYKQMLDEMINAFIKDFRLGESSILVRTLENVNNYFQSKIEE